MLESDLPIVTVIIPCRNEARFVENALNSILQGDYPADRIELLVVDGMSTDGTRKIVQEMAKKDHRIRLFDNPHGIVPSAMNIGIKAARGEYIARIDCHSTFAPDYISQCVEVLERTGADGVGGYLKTLPGNDSSVALAIAVATSSRFGVGNSAFRTGGAEQEVDAMPFGAFKKEVFDRIGLYDERLVRNQDVELYARIRKAGGHIIISPKIQVSYFNRATYRGLQQQSFNNGLWNPYTFWLTGRGLALRHFIPMFFVLGLITFSIGILFWWPFKWMLTGYILLYLSSAWFFAAKLARHEKTSPFLILWSYIVLHVSYGVGSVWAIVTIPFKFPNRKTTKVGEPLADREM